MFRRGIYHTRRTQGGRLPRLMKILTNFWGRYVWVARTPQKNWRILVISHHSLFSKQSVFFQYRFSFRVFQTNIPEETRYFGRKNSKTKPILKKTDRLLNKLWFEIPKIRQFFWGVRALHTYYPQIEGKHRPNYFVQYSTRLHSKLFNTVHTGPVKAYFFDTRPQYTVHAYSILNFLYSIF